MLLIKVIEIIKWCERLINKEDKLKTFSFFSHATRVISFFSSYFTFYILKKQQSLFSIIGLAF